MAIKTIKVKASPTTAAIPLHIQTSLPALREVRTRPPRAQGLLDWNSFPLRKSFILPQIELGDPKAAEW